MQNRDAASVHVVIIQKKFSDTLYVHVRVRTYGGYIAILCTRAIACVTADGILIAKSILNCRMTAHLRRQAALLSRALDACVHTYRALDAYIVCVKVSNRATTASAGSIVLSIAREDILRKI